VLNKVHTKNKKKQKKYPLFNIYIMKSGKAMPRLRSTFGPERGERN
jgi:hypothetical protein